MPARDAPTTLTPSLLDRLIDPDAGGTGYQPGYSVTQMTAAVLRDLEDLLNTRCSITAVPAQYTEVLGSICVFGMPELHSLNAISDQQRGQIGDKLEEIIRRFEPRLEDIRVTVVPQPDPHLERTIRFRIEARLAIDPAPPVVFDTVVELTTGHHSVHRDES
jgi:type VI secretion system protein ImpF